MTYACQCPHPRPKRATSHHPLHPSEPRPASPLPHQTRPPPPLHLSSSPLAPAIGHVLLDARERWMAAAMGGREEESKGRRGGGREGGGGGRRDGGRGVPGRLHRGAGLVTPAELQQTCAWVSCSETKNTLVFLGRARHPPRWGPAVAARMAAHVERRGHTRCTRSRGGGGKVRIP